MEHCLSYRDRSFDIGKVIWPIQRPVRTWAKTQILEVFDDLWLRGRNDQKDTGGDIAQCVVNNSTLMQYTTVFAWTKNLGERIGCGIWPVHATNIGKQAGRIGYCGHLDHGFCAIDKRG